MENKIIKRKVGRPTIIDEETVKKLEAVLKLGVNYSVACRYAKISRETFYNHLKSNSEFYDRIQSAKEFTRIAAAQTIVRAFVEDRDVKAAQWWLEKKFPDEFGAKETAPQVNIFQNTIVNKAKEYGLDEI